MKRSKENRNFWNTKIADLFTKIPQSQLTEYRQRAVRGVLIQKHEILKTIPKEKLIEILKDADYISRKMRYLTEGKQKEIKQRLMQEKIVEIYWK